MAVITECNRVLEKLYDTLINDTESVSPVFSINMKGFSELLKITTKQLNLYLWILDDAGYIKCQYTAYDRGNDGGSKEITLLPSAFSKVEGISF